MMNILLILGDMYSRNMPARPEIVEIYGRSLPDMGHSVTLVSRSQAGPAPVFSARCEGARMVVVRTPQGTSLASKTGARIRWLRLAYVVTTRLLKSSHVDVLQSRDDWMAGLVALFLARRHRKPLVFQYSFPFAEWRKVLYRRLHGLPGALAARLEAHMFYFVMRRADLLLPISKMMSEDLTAVGIRTRMRAVPMAANMARVASADDSLRIRHSLGLGDSPVVLYIGTMASERDLAVLLRAFATVAISVPETRLLMVGDGDSRVELQRLAKALGVEEAVVFTGEVPYDEVPAYIASCDVAVSPVPPLDIYKMSSPTKLFEYMSAGKAVVANHEIREHQCVLESSEAGLLTPYTAQGFADAICTLLEDRQSREDMGTRGRVWVEENRSYRVLASMLAGEYEALIARVSASTARHARSVESA